MWTPPTPTAPVAHCRRPLPPGWPAVTTWWRPSAQPRISCTPPWSAGRNGAWAGGMGHSITWDGRADEGPCCIDEIGVDDGRESGRVEDPATFPPAHRIQPEW